MSEHEEYMPLYYHQNIHWCYLKQKKENTDISGNSNKPITESKKKKTITNDKSNQHK